MPLKAMLFDMDGTLTLPHLDFRAIKREIGIPVDAYILEALEHMSPQEQRRAMAIVERHEEEAARLSRLNPGAAELIAELARRHIATGIVTRNSRVSVETVLKRHGLDVTVVVCREQAAPKPSPEGIRLALVQLNVQPCDAVYVGDHMIDIEAGRAAGTRTIWVANKRQVAAPPDADFAVEEPRQIVALLDILAR